MIEIFARSDFGPMKVGETRKFQVDKTKKKNCRLPGPEIVEIEIKKEKSSFKMVEPIAEASIHCSDGYVASVKAHGIAENCGIGKILMQLCMNEKKIHNVERKDKNKALKKLDDYIQECEAKELCSKSVQPRRGLKYLKMWFESECSKVIYAEMEAKQKCIQIRLRHKPHLYFSSAKSSGFTDMIMVSQELKDIEVGAPNINFYPRFGLCPVEALHERYSEVSCSIVDGYEKTLVWGMNWFFCHPKKKKENSDCTNVL